MGFHVSRAPKTPYASVALINGWANGAGNMWGAGGLPLFAINDSYSITETLSKIYNNHTLKFGGLIERATKVQNLDSVAEGRFEFEADRPGQPATPLPIYILAESTTRSAEYRSANWPLRISGISKVTHG